MQLDTKKILIKTRRQVFSEMLGNNTSLFKGEGYDFLELKEYEYGEDVKNIDWVISAKMQKPYVKIFHAQREININIVNLLGGSLFFGTQKFKHETLLETASILGFSATSQGDPFSAFIANDRSELITKKSKKNFAVHQMVERIANYDLIGKQVDFQSIQEQLIKELPKRSILFLIGDFFEIENLDLSILNKKHEVVAIIIRDRFEENPVELGNVNLIDLSTHQNFDGVISKSTLKNYTAKLKAQDHQLFEHLQKHGIKNIKIYTDEEPISKLIRLFG